MTEGAPLYRRVMGGDFDKLAPPLQRFHSLAGEHVLEGSVEVEGPANAAARVLALFLGAPLKAGNGPIRFELAAHAQGEKWTRHFPGKSMSSTFSEGAAAVIEQMGPAQLTFHLAQSGGTLGMHLVRMQFLGIPCPAWLRPRIVAKERGEADRLHFHVEAMVPGIGRVAGYRGYLRIP